MISSYTYSSCFYLFRNWCMPYTITVWEITKPYFLFNAMPKSYNNSEGVGREIILDRCQSLLTVLSNPYMPHTHTKRIFNKKFILFHSTIFKGMRRFEENSKYEHNNIQCRRFGKTLNYQWIERMKLNEARKKKMKCIFKKLKITSCESCNWIVKQNHFGMGFSIFFFCVVKSIIHLHLEQTEP